MHSKNKEKSASPVMGNSCRIIAECDTEEARAKLPICFSNFLAKIHKALTNTLNYLYNPASVQHL